MARISFIAPGLAASTHQCVGAALRRAGHEPAWERPDLCIANWFGGTLELPDDVPAVRWWVGSDVLALQAGRTRPHCRDERLNWAGSDWLARELRAEGVAARVLPIVPDWAPEPLPRAGEPTVLLYCPQGRERLYRWGELLAVAERCRDIRFEVFRRSEPSPLANLTCVPGFVGRGEMRAAYGRARAVLRLVEHDGMSLSVLEALGFGRHVVWSYPYVACRQAGSVEEAVRAVRQSVVADANTAGAAAMASLRRAADARLDQYVRKALG